MQSYKQAKNTSAKLETLFFRNKIAKKQDSQGNKPGCSCFGIQTGNCRMRLTGVFLLFKNFVAVYGGQPLVI